jgi:hypothetical protein
MAIISVEVPDNIAKARKFKPFTIIKYETLIWEDLEFDFKSENINQDEFLSYLKSKNG